MPPNESGPSGYVLATDIAEGIVELALQVARERGLKQIETRAMDGENEISLMLPLTRCCVGLVLCICRTRGQRYASGAVL